MNIEEYIKRVKDLVEKFSECDDANEMDFIIFEMDECASELVDMINAQYQAIKDVALGDHEVFKSEISKLFELSSLIEQLS